MMEFVRRRVIALLSPMMPARSLTRYRRCWVIWRARHPSRKRHGVMSLNTGRGKLHFLKLEA